MGLNDGREEDNYDNEESLVMVFLECKGCHKSIGCKLGDKPPRSCKEHN